MTTVEKIIYLREKQNLSQDELARLLGITPIEFENIERGTVEVNLTSLKTLARIFQVSLDFLVDDEKSISDLNATGTPTVKERYSFENYKLDVTNNDIAKFSRKIKPRFWENLPIAGSILYMARAQYKVYGIDRGTLRQQIMKYNLIFMFGFLLYFYMIFTLITPWFSYWQYHLAIKKTKKMLNEAQIAGKEAP